MDITFTIILYFVFLAFLGLIILIQNKHLQKISSFLPLTLKNLKSAVITVDNEEYIEYVNDAALDLLKYTKEELTGKKINLFLEKSASQAVTTTDTQDGKKPDKEIYETHCIDSGINKLPVSATVKRIYDKHAKLIGYIYLLKDLSVDQNKSGLNNDQAETIKQKEKMVSELKMEIENEKKSLEEKLKQRLKNFEEEHARLVSSINNLNFGFIMTDKDKNIILHNKSAVFFLPALNLISKTEHGLKNINENLFIQAEKSINGKINITLNDVGINSYYFNVYISPVLMEESGTDCLGAVIVMENMSEQHGLEQSKEDLFSIASHELRTPLTAIYGYVSLIKQIYFGNIQNNDLKNIINNIGILSKKLSMSINTFLDSSKLEQGKIEVKKEPCELYTIINEAVKETERVAIEKNLYIKIDLPTMPLIVMGDQLRLIQVMTILISNGVKFTYNGGVFITVSTKDNFAKISVRDTGAGIHEDNRLLLFSKFQQTEEDLLTRQEGTGLGLHMAKLLIEKMGGTIGLEQSEVNKGSTFAFTVPIYTQ